MATPASPEGLNPAQNIIDVIKETRRVLEESQDLFPDKGNSKLRGLKDAIGQFGVANLARLSLGQIPESVGVEELEEARGFVTAKHSWANEQARLRDTDIAVVARPLFIAAQNARLDEIADGNRFTVSRLDNTAHNAIRTCPEEGAQTVDGPVTGSLSRLRSEVGIFAILPEVDAPEPPTEIGYFATLLDHTGTEQLGLEVAA